MIRQFLDSFIPDKYKTDEDIYRKARLLVNLSFLVPIFSSNLLVVGILIGAPSTIVGMTFNAVVYPLIPFVFKKTENLNLCANLFTLVGIIGIGYTGYYQGGFNATQVPWLSLVPLVSLMLSNKNIAYFWLAVVYLIIVVLGFFKATESIYHPQINDIPVWFRTYQNIINQSSLVLIVFFITLVFENTKNFALNRLDEKNKIIAREKEISENLLLNILPYESAQELKLKGHSDARLYDYISVLFTDFKDFTIKSETLSPQALVAELDTCFRAFDLIMERHGIEKIKTIGDGYVAASGLPTENISHAENIVRAALDIRNFMSERRKEKGAATFEVRIGINSGPVVAGIVGVKKFAYDIWGDTVNIAARMEQNSEVGKINISQSTYELVKDKFTCTYRGKIDAKNKGQIDMYFVEA